MKIARLKTVSALGAAGALALSALALASAPAASAATDIKVGVGSYGEMGAIQYGIDSGMFARNGLNVTTVLFPAPAPGINALASGAVQFTYAPITPVLNAVGNGGVDLKIVAPGHGFSKADVARAKKDAKFAEKLDNSGVCVSPTSGITNFKGLEGKTVSVPARNAQGEITIANLIKKAGGDPKKVNWVTLTFPETVAAVKSGKVQAAYVIEPFLTQCTVEGLKNLGSPGILFLDESVISVWATTGPYAAANPAVVKAFQKSIAEANAFSMKSRANAQKAQVAATKLTKVPADIAAKARSLYYPLTVTKADVEDQAKKMLALGYLRAPINVPGLLLAQYR